MKLCIVTHKVIKGDGQGRVNYETVWEAIRRGHHVTVLASCVAPELTQNSQVNWIPISVKKYPTYLLHNLLFAWQSSVWLHQHRHTLDIIQVNGAITWVEADVNAVHFVHSAWLRSPVHTSRLRRDVYGRYQWLYTALNAYWEKHAFHQSKTVVATSGQVKQGLIDIDIPLENLRSIANGVDLQEFSPGSADRQPFGLPEGVPLALFAGDIRTPRKNLDTVLQALVQVPELHLAVAGIIEGSPYPQLATRLRVNDRVHFLGLRNDLPELMRAVDFLVFPSRYEPFGLVVIEAMASGLPVITATTTGAAEIITPACGIVLSDPDDAPALAQALHTLINNPDQRKRMGQAARTIAEQYSWANVARNYVDLFEELNPS
ncbi:MAG: glycosyltransferase family 4 protein [Cyanobacteria bacterium CRU_2_1]|nr:glycosyltransferase family 4 protein [Cyanobacteria bacterium RU_5_0]NJR60473.1 glycosyltransferase family 4 protein [Cyanobacteria bacterium CRU_2_1]